MRIKLKSIIVIITLLLSILIVGWNFDLGAKSLDDEVNSTSRSNINTRNKDFDWGIIETKVTPSFAMNFSNYVKNATRGRLVHSSK